jgi:hypothetical protein
MSFLMELRSAHWRLLDFHNLQTVVHQTFILLMIYMYIVSVILIITFIYKSWSSIMILVLFYNIIKKRTRSIFFSNGIYLSCQQQTHLDVLLCLSESWKQNCKRMSFSLSIQISANSTVYVKLGFWHFKICSGDLILNILADFLRWFNVKSRVNSECSGRIK